MLGLHHRLKSILKKHYLILMIYGYLTKYSQYDIQQGLEIHGLEKHGPWRYTVFNWIPKHLRYTVFGQKP